MTRVELFLKSKWWHSLLPGKRCSTIRDINAFLHGREFVQALDTRNAIYVFYNDLRINRRRK